MQCTMHICVVLEKSVDPSSPIQYDKRMKCAQRLCNMLFSQFRGFARANVISLSTL